ncbi:MAG: hypothetical protein Q4G33_11570 [bacterium]|nr:hypothetical protein [bacterium]
MAYIASQTPTSSTIRVYMDGIADINSLYEEYENGYDMSSFSFVLDWYITAPIEDGNLSADNYSGTWVKKGTQQYTYNEFQDLVYYVSDKNKTDVFDLVDLSPQSRFFVQCVVYVKGSNGVLNKYDYRDSGTGSSKYYESIYKGEYWTDEAPINFSSGKPDSISVYISNLDTSYDGIGRKVTWIVNNVEAGEQSIPNQIGETAPYEIPGLEPGTKYSITYKMLTAGYTSCDLTPKEYWTADAPYIKFVSSDTESITAQIVINENSSYNSILGNPHIKWYYSTSPSIFSAKPNYVDEAYNSTHGRATFSGLTSSTRYYFKCEILSSDESQSYYTTTETKSGDGVTPTDGFMTTDTEGGDKPYINYVGHDRNSITVYVTNTEKVYKDPYVAFIIYSTDSSFKDSEQVGHQLGIDESIRGYTDDISINELTAATTYYIKCDIYMGGQYMYTSDNYITVTTADQNGNGGGQGSGGSGGDIIVDPSKPVIQILKRDAEFASVRLTNITADSSARYIHWFASRETPVSLTDYEEYELQELAAGSTESGTQELIFQHPNAVYYIYCLITSTSSRPASKTDSNVLESGIATVKSEGISEYGLATNLISGAFFDYTYDKEASCGLIGCDCTIVTENDLSGSYLTATLYIIDEISGSVYLGSVSWDDGNLAFYLDNVYVNPKYCDNNTHTIRLEVGSGFGSEYRVLAEAEEDVLLCGGTSVIAPFSWTTNIQTGEPVRFDTTNNQFQPITADEWNEFCTKLNSVRTAKGLSAYTFTKVSIGTIFTKAIYNETVSALNDMLPEGSRLSEASSVNVINAIAASTYLTLSDRLNGLINTL